MRTWLAVPLLALVLLCSSSQSRIVIAAEPWTFDKMVAKEQGRAVFRARPVDEKFRNPISAADEEAFQSRARHVIAAQAKQKVAAGNTYFENEKRTYGWLMAQVLAGREEAIRELQFEDAQKDEWHRETAGIDFTRVSR